MLSHKKIALITIGAAAVFDIAGGLAFAVAEHLSYGLGLYWAVTTATTAGYGDITPKTTAGHYIAVMVMLTAIPLFTAAFSFFTAIVTSSQVHSHMRDSEERLKQHVEQRLRHHLGSGE